ncbi:hypothetical protein GGG16DRAFT_115419 [Schizophyllum commune]
MTENRDPERRRACKKAYYERNKERLRAKERQRARERYARDARVRSNKIEAVRKHRKLHFGIRARRLNLYRKALIDKYGVDGFRAHFVSTLSQSARAEIPHGILLEDWEDEVLREAYEEGMEDESMSWEGSDAAD